MEHDPRRVWSGAKRASFFAKWWWLHITFGFNFTLWNLIFNASPQGWHADCCQINHPRKVDWGLSVAQGVPKLSPTSSPHACYTWFHSFHALSARGMDVEDDICGFREQMMHCLEKLPERFLLWWEIVFCQNERSENVDSKSLILGKWFFLWLTQI